LVGHAEPTTRIIPFFLTPQEQQELDEFLIRWEKYSLGIKRYDVDFNMFLYDEAIPGSIPGKPYKTAFGYFKYIAKPLRFVYHVEGEWIDNKKVERDEKKNQHIYAEKIIIDEKSVFKYEFGAKKVLQVNVPPELIGKGIADSPLPLIFGAKAEDMKKRFSMKIVTAEQHKNTQIWLRAKPLLIEDQQEFSQIEIRLDKDSLRATALKKDDINGKAFTAYTLLSPKINDRLTSFLEDIRKWFTPTVPDGWTLDVNDWVLEAQMAQRPATTVLPTTPSGNVPAIPATPQPPFANQPQPPRNEIPLYQPK
jgi:TIGR03009 family protein